MAYDAATVKFKPTERHRLFKTYMTAFKRTDPMKGNILTQALSNVKRMALRDLPEIPGFPEACEDDLRILALHQQMHILTKDVYGLSQKAIQQAPVRKISWREASAACELLEMYGLIQIVDRGTPRMGTRKGAARYRYIGDSDERLF
jgi:hypothetical protein